MEHLSKSFRHLNSYFRPSDNFLPENTLPSNCMPPVGNSATRPMQKKRHWNCGQLPRRTRDKETAPDYEELNVINENLNAITGLVQQMKNRQRLNANDSRIDQHHLNVGKTNQRITVAKLARELAELKNEFKNRETRTTEDIRLLTEQNRRMEEKLQRAFEESRTPNNDTRNENAALVRKYDKVKTRLAAVERELQSRKVENENAALVRKYDKVKTRLAAVERELQSRKVENENAALVRKYDKVKTRLAAVERELQTCKVTLAARDSDHSLLSMMLQQTRSVCYCSGGGGVGVGTRVFAEGPSRALEMTTTTTSPVQHSASSSPEPPRFTPSVAAVSAPQPPSVSSPPPPPPPPPPMPAPKAAPQRTNTGADGKIVYGRMQITADMLKSVSLAKDGEPIKKIKLPRGIVINRKKTAAADAAEDPKTNASAAAPNSNAARSPLITAELLKSVTLAKDGEPVKKIKMPHGMVIVKRSTEAIAPASSASSVEPESIASTSRAIVEPEPIASTSSEIVEPEPVATTSSAIVEPEPIASTSYAIVEPEPIASTSYAIVEPEPIASTSSTEVIDSTTSSIVEQEVIDSTISSIIEPEATASTSHAIVEPEMIDPTSSAIVEPEMIASTSSAVTHPRLSSSQSLHLRLVDLKLFNQTGPATGAENDLVYMRSLAVVMFFSLIAFYLHQWFFLF